MNGFRRFSCIVPSSKFALVLQLLLLIPYCIKARHFQQSAGDVIRKLLDTLVLAASPALPAVWLLVALGAMARLKKQSISMLYVDILKLGATVNVVAMDKTGTLTESTVRWMGITSHYGTFLCHNEHKHAVLEQRMPGVTCAVLCLNSLASVCMELLRTVSWP